MKKIVISLTALFIAYLLSGKTDVSGPVSGIWDTTGSPYIAIDHIYVESGSTLTIEPGVEVIFNGWYKFTIYGSLEAIGTENDSIIFTAADTNKRWHGIRFMEVTAESKLEYCLIEYGLTITTPQGEPDNCGGGILCYKSPGGITISHCFIRNNIAYFGGGIQIYSSSPLIDNCRIEHNKAMQSGGAIECFDGADLLIENTTMSFNSTAFLNGGAIQLYENCNSNIIGCTITHNYSAYVGGGIQSWNSNNLHIERTLIAHNKTDAGKGAGIHLSNDTSVNLNGMILNSIIANNKDIFGYGAGIYFKSNVSPVFKNSIIYYNVVWIPANGTNVYLEHDNCDPDFLYCDIEGGKGGFEGPGSGNNYNGIYFENIETKPFFNNPDSADYSLTWSSFPEGDSTKSPCIDRGDPESENDPDNTRSDIGVFYFDQMPETPLAYEIMHFTDTSFTADWSSSYGALGYILDVAMDEQFTDYLTGYENLEINDTLSWHEVMGTPIGQTMYFRVKAKNEACASDYSNTILFLNTSIDIIKEDIQAYHIYAYGNNVHINCRDKPSPGSQVYIYDVNGRLLAGKLLYNTRNTIMLHSTRKIILVKLLLNGKTYQHKLLVN